MRLTSLLIGGVLLAASVARGVGQEGQGNPPAPPREFRGVWIATVDNIDWPSRPGLPAEQQQAELIALLDRAAQLRLNAVVFQIRPACDALYASKLEPWSDFLTGQMGKAPEPYYDPLAFAVAEAHRRGLELHAWFNPYRAHHPASKVPVSPEHISKTRPELVKEYGRYLWLDPGEKAVQEHSLSVLLDVVRRYDVDGVHIDDYFYPYKEKDAEGKILPFPDDPSWQKYQASGGTLSRDDWRRENVDSFIRRVYEGIKKEKPSVRFGISPFGIWRPGYPAQIQGFDQYSELYADARKWLQEGWVDYFTPQLYWRIEPPAQSYPVLLKWWTEQNPHARHLWPGNFASPVTAGKWPLEEMVNQVRVTREQPGATGNVFFSAKDLMKPGGVGDALAGGPYAAPALVPASTWLGKKPPGKPKVTFGKDGPALSWAPGSGENPWLWVVQLRRGGQWTTEVLPAGKDRWPLAEAGAEQAAVSAVDRLGNQGPPAVVAIKRK